MSPGEVIELAAVLVTVLLAIGGALLLFGRRDAKLDSLTESHGRLSESQEKLGEDLKSTFTEIREIIADLAKAHTQQALMQNHHQAKMEDVLRRLDKIERHIENVPPFRSAPWPQPYSGGSSHLPSSLPDPASP